MKFTCEHCGHAFEGTISLDELGWHTACPKCEGSFDVDVYLPHDRIQMFFMDDSDPDEEFSDEYRGQAVISHYTFGSVKDFIAKWNEVSECPDSMWYWCYDGEVKDENCFCSGACDPNDIEIFKDYFFCNEDGLCYPQLHERNPEYTYWLYDTEEDRVFDSSVDMYGRVLVYQKRRYSLFYDAATNKPLVPQPAFYVRQMRARGRTLAQKFIPSFMRKEAC